MGLNGVRLLAGMLLLTGVLLLAAVLLLTGLVLLLSLLTFLLLLPLCVGIVIVLVTGTSAVGIWLLTGALTVGVVAGD